MTKLSSSLSLYLRMNEALRRLPEHERKEIHVIPGTCDQDANRGTYYAGVDYQQVVSISGLEETLRPPEDIDALYDARVREGLYLLRARLRAANGRQ